MIGIFLLAGLFLNGMVNGFGIAGQEISDAELVDVLYLPSVQACVNQWTSSTRFRIRECGACLKKEFASASSQVWNYEDIVDIVKTHHGCKSYPRSLSVEEDRICYCHHQRTKNFWKVKYITETRCLLHLSLRKRNNLTFKRACHLLFRCSHPCYTILENKLTIFRNFENILLNLNCIENPQF